MTKTIEKDDQLTEINTHLQKLTTYWAERNKILLTDREIINLVRSDIEGGEKKDNKTWIVNEPKVFFDTSRTLLSLNDPRFKLPITINYEPAEKDKMNKAERLCIGIYRSMNDRHCNLGGTDWLWDLTYWILLGWYAVSSIVRKNNGQIEFISDIYDPVTIFPWWDSNGLAVCLREFEVDPAAAEAMVEAYAEQGLNFDYQVPPKSSGNVKVVNYWKREYKKNNPVVSNAIIIGGNVIKPMTIQKRMRRIPIEVGAVGSPDQTSPMWMTRKGESIIASDREMYYYKNIILTLRAEILASTAEPNRIWKLLNPQQKVSEMRGHGEDIKLKPQESLELLKHMATPQDADYLLADINQAIQKGSIPNLTYGGSPAGDLSGFAISQLLATVKYKLGPYLKTGNRLLGRIMTEFLYQYKTGGFKEIELNTTDPHAFKQGQFYLEKFSIADVPDHTYVDVDIPISTQFDKTQAILNAVQAIQSGINSRETLWENVPELGVSDSEQEKERIVEDKVSNDPFVMDLKITQSMWNMENYYRNVAHDIPRADALKKYIQLKEVNLGLRQGIVSTKNQPGVPPNQMPPEASPAGQPSPDTVRAMNMQPPPSPNRPTDTSGVNAGRKGTLVSPSGQPLM